ncbi:hypothetical protein UC317_1104 [Lactococcus lactis subsp. lactis]|nr:hypothetical protein UC317_1104 [Lactococcus lactis subsp. lactis]
MSLASFVSVATLTVKSIHLSLTKAKIFQFYFCSFQTNTFIFGGVPQSPFLKKINSHDLYFLEN